MCPQEKKKIKINVAETSQKKKEGEIIRRKKKMKDWIKVKIEMWPLDRIIREKKEKIKQFVEMARIEREKKKGKMNEIKT